MQVSKFDPSTIRPNSRIMALGRRAAGKTSLVTDLSKHVHSHIMYNLADLRKNEAGDIPLTSTVFFEAAHIFDVKPTIRRILDYVFIFSDVFVHSKQQIYREFGTCVPTFEAFCAILDKCTANPHECLVIDLHTGDLWWYKARASL